MKQAWKVIPLKAAVSAALASFIIAAPLPAFSQEEDNERAHETAITLPKVDLQQLLSGTEVDFLSAKSVYNQALLRDGGIKPLLEKLEGYAKDSNKSVRYRANALLVGAHLHWCGGHIDKALDSIERAVQIEANADTLLMKAHLLEANGNAAAARGCYEQVMPLLKNEDYKEKVRLRLTFLDVGQKNIHSLVDLAKKRDPEFRNRAAVALAILGHYSEATKLYAVHPDAEGSVRYREHLRLAQWSIRAGNAQQAQAEVWQAVQSATLQRDRRYALSVAIDAYEMDGALDKLLQKFSEKGVVTEEEQDTRIEILRQLKRYDEAIKLFLAANSLQLSPEAQTELLRMYRDSGRSQEMIAEFNKLIVREPNQPIWVEGLTQYLLEQHERTQAQQAWEAFIARNSEARPLLLGARAMTQFGFDELAMQASEKCLTLDDESVTAALMFRFNLNRRRGQIEQAEQALLELKKRLPADSMRRVDIANSYERLSKQKEALQVLEELNAARPTGVGLDEKMRMAWMYDVLGERVKAQDMWRALWEANPSPVRRKLMENRLLLLAAETGTLGELAVELEKKLRNGTAREKDTTLLIRIYTDTQDMASALEIIQEYFKTKKGGKDSVESLREQARVYQTMGRFGAYEKVTTQLLDLDPENKIDNLQSLLLNALEREDVNLDKKDAPGGQHQSLLEEKRRPTLDKVNGWLSQLREVGGAAVDAEFEAGVLELGGLDDQALAIYRRALAEKPGHSDLYLLMANLLKTQSRETEALALLQYGVETAQRDDEFIVAVDGILNMRPKDNAMLRWTQNRVLERLTARADKLYLYELLSELAEWEKDSETYLSALENSLAYANSRRSSVLRELSAATSEKSKGLMAVVTGQFKKVDLRRNLEYSRRLIALREDMPPEVYMDMGKTFLQMGDLSNATDAFNMALDRTGRGSLIEETGDLLKKAGYNKQAMGQYERALIADAGSASVMYKLSDARAVMDFGGEANAMYLKALDNVVRSQPIEIEKGGEDKPPPLEDSLTYDYKSFYWQLLGGFMRTLPDDAAAERLAVIEKIFSDALVQTTAKPGKALVYYPRLSVAMHLARMTTLCAGRYELADKLDGMLLQQFAHDQVFIGELIEQRMNWGLRASAQQLVAQLRQVSKVAAERFRMRVETQTQNGLELVTVSKAMTAEALANKQYEMAVNVAVENKDLDGVQAIYRDWLETVFVDGNYEYGSIGSVMGDARKRLDAQQFGVLCKHLFDVAASRPDVSKKLLSGAGYEYENSLLLDLEKVVGRSLLSSEQIIELAGDLSKGRSRGLDMRYAMSKLNYNQKLEVLLRYLESAELRTVNWGLVFSTLESLLIKPLSADVSAQIVGRLKDLVRQAAMDKSMAMDGPANQLSQVAGWANSRFTRGIDKANVALFEELEAYLVSTYPVQIKPGVLKTGILMDSGRVKEAMPLFLDNALVSIKVSDAPNDQLRAMRGTRANDYSLSSARMYLRLYDDVITAGQWSELLALAESNEEKSGPTEQQFLLEVLLLERMSPDGAAKRMPWLEEKVKRCPKNELVLNELRAEYEAEGYVDREIALLEQLVALAPKNMAYHWRLFSLWQAYNNPERALNAATGRLPDVLKTQDEVSAFRKKMREYSFDRSPPLSMTAQVLLKQIVAVKNGGDAKSAQMSLRSLWQLMPLAPPPPGYSVRSNLKNFGRATGLEGMDYQSLTEIDWEYSAAAPDEEQSAADDLVSLASQDLERNDFDRSGKFLDTVSQYSFSIPEFESFIRSAKSTDIDQQYLMYKLLADAYVKNNRAGAEFERLGKILESGNADNRSFVLWLELAVHQPQPVLQSKLPAVEKQLLQAGAIGKYQTMLLARVYARAGRAEQAVDLYSASILSALTYRPGREIQRLFENQPRAFFDTVLGLYDDAKMQLDAASLDKLAARMLPMVSGTVNNGWRRRYYLDFVMTLLERNPKLTAAQSEFQAALAADAKAAEKIPALNLRDLARAAYIQVSFGQTDAALKTLQLALTRPNPSSMYGNHDRNSSALGLPSPRRARQAGGQDIDPGAYLLSMGTIFPLNAADDVRAGLRIWSARVTDAIPGWLAQGILRRDAAIQLLSLIAIRQQHYGFAQEAGVSAQLLGQLLAQPQDVSMVTATLAIHAMDKAGAMANVQTLQTLLQQKRIDPEYLAQLVRRAAQAVGVAQAVSLGELAAGYSQDPELLQTLKNLCVQSGDTAKSQHWTEVERRATEARARIERGEDFQKANTEVAAMGK